MVKKYIGATLLITAVGLLVGCGMSGKEDLGNNKVQEITLVDEQKEQSNRETEVQVQDNSVQNESIRKDDIQDDSKQKVELSIEDAKKLALERVEGATENDVWIELDYDDGHYVYEGEILYGQKEYEFEIDANTGTFLEWSEERK